MRKISFHEITYCLMLAATVGASVIFLFGMLFRGGNIDINALYNQYGWKYGEGWLETIGYITISLLGIIELINMKKK